MDQGSKDAAVHQQGEVVMFPTYAGYHFDMLRKVEGLLTSKNAGGNCTYPTFMVNPQYRLIIHPFPSRPGLQVNGSSSKAKLTLTLQTNKDIPVNVAVVWSQGKRVSESVYSLCPSNDHGLIQSLGFLRKRSLLHQVPIAMVWLEQVRIYRVGVNDIQVSAAHHVFQLESTPSLLLPSNHIIWGRFL